ncbi:MAG: hypothetical protein N4A47_07455 [Clostridia bacterium]|jgi:hypothetical protein|nr:hypothetical protein [Clostridia bacterium]
MNDIKVGMQSEIDVIFSFTHVEKKEYEKSDIRAGMQPAQERRFTFDENEASKKYGFTPCWKVEEETSLEA